MLGRRVMDETGEEEGRGRLRAMLSDRYVHFKRVAEITAALSRYGFGRLGDTAARVRELRQDPEERRELAGERAAVRFRMLLESLGPTFIKLGQMLSTRPDLIDEEFADELGNLREDAPPVPFDQVREVVESELGTPLGELFEAFDEEPLASASIGQVHRARLATSGAEVAVKVQRPGVQGVIRADIEILRDLAGVLERTLRSIERFDPRGVVDEFAHMITREVDYTVEARNIQRFRDNLASVEGVRVPAVHFSHSTRLVLTMDLVEGVAVSRLGGDAAAGVDTGRLVRAMGTAYIKQIFVDGFFHADPHHGNLFVGPGGELTFIDFGAVGYLDEDERELVTDLYMALMRGDEVKAARALSRLCGADLAPEEAKRLAWDLRDLIDHLALRHGGVELDRGMNQRVVTIALKRGMALPSSFVLLERTLFQVEGVARSLDQDFDVIDLTRENLPMLLRERLRPDREPLQAMETARDYSELVRELPGRVDALLGRLESGTLKVQVEVPALDAMRRQVRMAGLMVSVSLVALALIASITWAGISVDIPIARVTLTLPLVVLIWLLALVVIYRRV